MLRLLGKMLGGDRRSAAERALATDASIRALIGSGILGVENEREFTFGLAMTALGTPNEAIMEVIEDSRDSGKAPDSLYGLAMWRAGHIEAFVDLQTTMAWAQFSKDNARLRTYVWDNRAKMISKTKELYRPDLDEEDVDKLATMIYSAAAHYASKKVVAHYIDEAHGFEVLPNRGRVVDPSRLNIPPCSVVATALRYHGNFISIQVTETRKAIAAQIIH